MTTRLTVDADPTSFLFEPATTALLVIDMQRDFVEPGGFGETLGTDVSQLRGVIAPLPRTLAAPRAVVRPAIASGPMLRSCSAS